MDGKRARGEPGNTVDRAVRAVQAFRHIPVRTVLVADVEACEEFQARNLELVRAGSVQAMKGQRSDLVAAIRRDLEGDPTHRVEPVWVADVDGRLCVLDGFHRLHAFRLASRQVIPAQVQPMTRGVAIAVSLLVNEGDRRTPRAPGERTEAAWQTLGLLTGRGTHDRPQGWNSAHLARVCGVHRNTVVKMDRALARIAGVALDEFKGSEINRQTGWITWRAAYSHGRTYGEELQGEFTSMQERSIERIRQRIGRDLARIREWSQRQDPKLCEEALRRIREEAYDPSNGDLETFNLAALIDEHDGADF